MKSLILADLHYVPYNQWQSFLTIDQTQFDIVLCLGDIEFHYLKDITRVFSEKTILGVQGNHDYPKDLESVEITNLHGVTFDYLSKQFLGAEGCVRYKTAKRPMYTQEEMILFFKDKPAVDIVISHNSPKDIHDNNSDLSHEGYIGLKNYMHEKRPLYIFHGHQHINRVSQVDETLVIGVFGGILFNFSTHELTMILEIEDVS